MALCHSPLPARLACDSSWSTLPRVARDRHMPRVRWEWLARPQRSKVLGSGHCANAAVPFKTEVVFCVLWCCCDMPRVGWEWLTHVGQQPLHSDLDSAPCRLHGAQVTVRRLVVPSKTVGGGHVWLGCSWLAPPPHMHAFPSAAHSSFNEWCVLRPTPCHGMACGAQHLGWLQVWKAWVQVATLLAVMVGTWPGTDTSCI